MRLYTILILLLILPTAIAEDAATTETSFDPIPSYDWLNNNTNTNSLPAREAAFALLALNNQNYDIESKLNLFIANQGNDCWPRDGCTVVDTALGLLVLENTGQETNNTVTWLNQREIPAGSIGGIWYLQIVTTNNGTCDVECDGKTTEVDVSQWAKVDTLGCGSIGSKKSQNYYVDCSNVGDPSMHITLLYQIEKPEYSETFLLQDEQAQQMDVTVDNACYPKSLGGTACDLESTLYATWVLSLLGEEVHTIPYIEERLNEITNDPLKLALLYMIRPDSIAYGNLLMAKQKPSGSWLDDIYKTSIASLALVSNSDSYLNATKWIQLKRDKKDFTWNQKIINTAVALIALHGTIDSTSIDLGMGENVIEICDDGTDNNDDSLIDCDDPECSSDLACVCDITKNECASNSDCMSKGNDYTCDSLSCTCVKSSCSILTDECESDSDCITIYGGDYSCDPILCTCQGPETPSQELEICDDETDNNDDGLIDCDDSDCEGDPACEGGSGWVWALIFILLIGGGFSGFYYVNYIKKGKGFSDFKNDFNLFVAGLFKKKPKKTSFEEHVAAKEKQRQAPFVQQPVQQKQTYYQRSSTKQKGVEDELEKSLQEAKKLLGGK